MKPIYLSITLVILSFILGLAFYNILPDRIITHWNASGIAKDIPENSLAYFLFQ